MLSIIKREVQIGIHVVERKSFYELHIGKDGFKGSTSHVPVPNTKQPNVMSMRMHEVFLAESQLLSISQI